ncbi:MAG: dehydrogenase subunit [Proteobacteria bacterium]|nr:dehydrogenase subunit [Pseudomonadota bacterium]
MIALAVALPLLGAFLLPLMGPLKRVFGPAVLLAVAALALSVWPQAQAEPFAVAIGEFRAPLGIVFYVDGVAALFTLAVALVCLLLWPWSTPTEDATAKQSLTLILAGACAGLAVSGDLFNIYVFYELVAVASYGLAAGSGSAAGYAAAFRYLVLSSLASMLALIGITLIYYRTGTVNLAHLAQVAPDALHDPLGLAAFLLLLLGLGVKAELFPVNAWVPEVYATAERRVAALLAGLVSKLALLVLVRLLVLVFPLDPARFALLALGTLGILSGELAAYRARDLARMLSWSSIGQLGIAFVAFAIPGKAGVVAGLAVALHHLIAKPALFLLAERWGGSIEGLAGAGRRSKLGGALFVLFALSLVGVPPLPGFWAKLLVLSGLAAQEGGAWWLAAAVILAMTVVEAAYLFRVVGRLYAPDTDDESQPHGAAYLAAAGILGLCLIAGSVSAGPLGHALGRMAAQVGDRDAYIARVLPAGETRP